MLHLKKIFMASSVVVLAILVISSSAQAKLTGNYTRFAQCPCTNFEVKKCIISITESGEVVLGSKKVPIVNPVTLQGGYGIVGEDEFSQFYGASNGVTLSNLLSPFLAVWLVLSIAKKSPMFCFVCLVKQLSKMVSPVSTLRSNWQNLLLRSALAKISWLPKKARRLNSP